MENSNDYYGQMMAKGAVNATGAVVLQSEMTIGGQRHVFVDLPGAVKEAFRRPPIGGLLKNPFPGPAKIYAGDLIEHSLGFADASGGTVKVLKSYEVAKATAGATDTAIYITRDGYHHIPFVGDNLMVGQKTFTTKAKGVTVTAVTEEEQDGKEVWKLTLSETLGTLTVGTVLVEASASGANVLPMVTNPNCFAPCDVDMPFFTQTGSDKYHAPRYFNDFCLLGTDVVMWKSRMSPIPPALEAMNKSRYPEWWYAEN